MGSTRARIHFFFLYLALAVKGCSHAGQLQTAAAVQDMSTFQLLVTALHLEVSKQGAESWSLGRRMASPIPLPYLSCEQSVCSVSLNSAPAAVILVAQS